MHARVKLTTDEGIRDFLAGRIDRFSISWFKRGETLCSVCGKDVFGSECPHVPGRTYAIQGQERLCEMVQAGPIGREISAVNVPASAGTHVLSELVVCKESMMEDQGTVDNVAATAYAGTPSPRLEDVPGEIVTQFQDLRAEVLGELKELKVTRNRLQLETALEQSGLPEAAQILIRQVTGQQPECLDMAEVDRLIAAQKALLAEAAQPTVVTGMRPLYRARAAHRPRRHAGGARLVPRRPRRPHPRSFPAQHPRRLPRHHGRRGLLRRLQPRAQPAERRLDRHPPRPRPQQPQQGRAPALRQPGHLPLV